MYAATFKIPILNHVNVPLTEVAFVEIYAGGRLEDFRVSIDGSAPQINRCLYHFRSTREQNEE